MKWKMLALDLDGTTLNSNEEISDENHDAIMKASAEGIRVIVTTGRSYASATHYIQQLNTGDPSITYNGALIRENDAILRTLSLDHHIISRCLHTLKGLGQIPILYSIDEKLHDEKRYIDNPGGLSEAFHQFSKGSGVQNVTVDDVLDHAGEQVIRISVFSDRETTEMLDRALTEQFGNSIATALTFFPNWDFWIFEVLNTLCTKPAALQFLCDLYGIRADEVIAVGDNGNDIGMLRWAGLGIAMRNSLPDVSVHADHVSMYDNDEHGIAELIERFILSETPCTDCAVHPRSNQHNP
jgi:Cof subfamily protein (haloacid dehalogenase superfamily)